MHKKLRFYTQFIPIILTMLFIQISFPINVHADGLYGVTPGEGNVDDMGSGGGTGGNVIDELLISQDNAGYRIYLEDSGGSVASPVIDLYFGTIPPNTSNMYRGDKTSIGGATVSQKIQYSAIDDVLPGLITPIQGHTAQGVYINAWFEQKNSKYPESTNADIFLAAVFTAAGSQTHVVSEYIENFHKGEYRIVVEGIYWYGYVRSNKTIETVTTIKEQVPDQEDPDKMITVERQEWTKTDTQVKEAYHSTYNRMWFYGTVKELADYEQGTLATDPTHRKDLGMDKIDPTFQSGTYWLFGHTNSLMATTLQLVTPDEFSGLGGISGAGGAMGGYTYSQIQNPGDSYGIHVIRREQASEKWATYDASAYGGPVGKSPGVTPKMPPLAGMENVTTTWRDVTVIKYYEEYSTDKETGKARSS